MYIEKHFEQNDRNALLDLMRSYPLATLVMYNEQQGLQANHIPLFLVEKPAERIVLKGHIAKSNSLWETFENESPVLALFHGPESYISPNYYPSKKTDPKVVPTWNYLTAHARGTIRFIEDPTWKLQLLHELTTQHEAEQSKPWSVDDAPKTFTDKLLSAIVGIEIDVSQLQGKFKMSQNQSSENQAGVIAGLSESKNRRGNQLAEVMAQKPR